MEPPEKPDECDCCNSGCTPCILDIYEIQLAKYKQYLENPSKFNCVETYNKCLSQLKYSLFELIYKERETNDCFKLIFKYVKEDKNSSYQLLYNPGQHLLLINEKTSAHEQGQYRKKHNNTFTKAYTPIPFKSFYNFNEQLCFMILVKIYNEGKMSKFISNLKLGDFTKWRGPYGDFEINFTYEHLLCISQGTGISPIYSVTHSILQNEECETRIQLYACYKDLDNVLLRNEVFDLIKYWNFQCTSYLAHESRDEHELNKTLKYNEKVICKNLDKDDLEKYLKFINNDNLLVLICGTDAFNTVFIEYLKQLNIQNIHVF